MKQCATCGSDLRPRWNGARQKFCNIECYAKSLRTRAKEFANSDAFAEKFHNLVDRRGPNECWPWTGTFNGNGYGKIGGSPFSRRKNRKDYAHRVAYALANSGIPADLIVRHTCDNRSCVNPGHLIIGTIRQNSADAVERKRIRHGASHPCAKLNVDIVIAIRGSTETHTELAAKFGVADSTILRVRQGKSWRHAPSP